MFMTNALGFNRHDFAACEWLYDVLPEERYGYSSLMRSIQKAAKEKIEIGQEAQFKILDLLGRAASMMLIPSSLNEPFKPCAQDYQAGTRSALPEDFTTEELTFFEDILDDINEPLLKARLADLLWLCKKPKNPAHAKIAIESYVAHTIDAETWHRDVNVCWERAVRLCVQIGDFEKLNEIKSELFLAFRTEDPTSKFMTLWVASMLDKLKIDNDFKEDIATILFKIGSDLKKECDFNSARSYLELAAKKYHQCDDEQGRLRCLVSVADCWEQEADSRSKGSNMVANSFYENAIQAYRRIPAKHRETYDVDNKVKTIRTKITISGQASLGEMGLLKTPEVDISDMVQLSKAHVSGKNSFEVALMHFIGLYSGPDYNTLAASAKKSMQDSILGSLFGSSHMSADGRVVAKTPPMNLNGGYDDSANKAVLHRQIQQQFSIETQLVVEGQILPALRQLLKEHRVTKESIVALCHHSPIVPQNREYLLGHALWLGFEYDFGSAIHLLCPQVEHIARMQLKEAGAHTSNVDREGVENENGLSTIMDLPEATLVFGENLLFEIKSIFTDTLGSNLRNEVAHGLLDDNSSSTIATIYAWWMILRLVVRSIMSGNVHKGET